MTDSDTQRPRIPEVPKRSPKAKKPYALVAVVIVLLIAVAVLGGLDFAKSGTSAAPSVIGAQPLATVGQPYALSMYTGKFTSASVNFGDNTTTQVNYTGVDGIQVEHTYSAAGKYLVQYSVDKSGTVYANNGSLIAVQAVTSSTPDTASQGFDQIIVQNSSKMLVNNGSDVFSPGATITTLVGYYASPVNTSYVVYAQTAVVLLNDKFVSSYSVPYTFSSGKYSVSPDAQYLNITNASSGMYTVVVKTYSAVINGTTGAVDTSVPTSVNYYYLDIGVYKSGGLYVPPKTTSTLVDVNQGEGAYRTLDQAISSDVVSNQILQNTEMSLVMYNGNSTSQFEPMLASQVPSAANGGINTNYANYSVTSPWGQTYQVHVKPYENYTFHIRSNATWQNGQPVTAWDAEYSFARAFIFIGDSPANTIATLASLFLPNGNNTNTFWNITQNMTVDNQTNNITLHFQHQVSPAQVLGLLTGGGNTFVESASWIASQATPQQPALKWSAAGFAAYKAQGNAVDFNKNLQTNLFSDGPYQILYQVASSAVVLVKNPYFTAPGPWYPVPSIDEVVVEYIQKTSTRYLDLLSNSAQIGGISTTDWNLVQNLQNKNGANAISVPSPGMLWFEFNANVNMTYLNSLYPGQANMPSTLFTILPIRQAFAYAMDYQNFIEQDVGNAVYGATFSQLYAGVMSPGIFGAQNISELNKTTAGVPYYDLALAAHYWQLGVKIYNQYYTAEPSKQITNTSSGYQYEGKPLVIPMFYQTGFPAYKAAMGTWITALQTFMTGVQFPIDQVTISQEVGYLAYGTNPMPVAWFGWITNTAYPTSVLLPIAYPGQGSSFTYPDAFTPAFFNNQTGNNPTYNATQAGILQSMIDEYNNGSAAFQTSDALNWFHQMNDNLINMTMYVWMGQLYSQFVLSSHINLPLFEKYNTNPLTTSSPDIYFNGVSYS